MKDNKNLISIVIPCFNCENMIEIVVNNINDVFLKNKKYKHEIILVNDGSMDKTWDILKKLASNNKYIKAINFSHNFGQHSAMMAGYRKAKGELIVGMDDDGENDPAELFKLIDKLSEGYDCVCAEYEEHQGFIRKIGTKLNNYMACKLINKPKNITLTSYYVCKRFVINQAIKYQYCYPYVAGLLLQASKNWATVKLERKKRLEGKSGYTVIKLLRLWINGFTAFSVKPLRLAGILGFILSIVGLIVGIIVIIRKIFIGNMLDGYSSIMAALCFFSGITMIMLGIIGEYVGRIYVSMNNSPQYVISEEIDGEEKE